MKAAFVCFLFIGAAAIAGWSIQQDSGACLPEHHMAEIQNKQYCHCIAMGGYQNCDPKTGHYSYRKWAEENSRRSNDIDPKTKKQRQPDVPMCKMSCKEDACDCCAYMDQFKQPKKRAALTIPYDPL